MNYNEFSERVKVKYPEYKDIDNKELAEKIIAKYPEYENVVTFDDIKNITPSSSKHFDLTPSGLVNNTTNFDFIPRWAINNTNVILW